MNINIEELAKDDTEYANARAHLWAALKMCKRDGYTVNYEKRERAAKESGERFLDFYHAIYWIAKHKQLKTIGEIGVNTGLSICQLLHAMKLFGKEPERVVLFDLYESNKDIRVRENLKRIGFDLDKVTFVKGSSHEMLPVFLTTNLDVRFDYMLVDGDHSFSGALSDMNYTHNMLSEEGCFLLDNTKSHVTVVPAWQQFIQRMEDEYDFEDLTDPEGFDGQGFIYAEKKN
jgi:predicted O-methyltransferase YrrM